jgi:FlaA1/EpsC-like NDP-sugar epimerase
MTLQTVSKIVVVTGSRRWANRIELNEWLSREQPDILIHGGAAGADALAGRWANEQGVTCIVVPALWASLGTKAGSIRNVAMLDVAQRLADSHNASLLVLAFPAADSIGTRHCMNEALKRGVTVDNKGLS